MKSFKKALAAALALAMVVTAVPVTPAEAASTAKLSAKSVTVAAGTAKKQSKTIKVKTPSTWKKVKVVASSSNKKAATVKVSGKTVKVTAVKKGTAKVTVKVTAKKGKKAVKKTLYATAKVVNDGLRITSAPTELTVGGTAKVAAKVCPSTAKVTYSSDKTDVATVAEDGTVTAVKAGEATIKVTSDYGKTAETKIVVKDAEAQLTAVKQTSSNAFTATFSADASKVTKDDITVAAADGSSVCQVKAVTLSADKLSADVTIYNNFKDATDYNVTYKDSSKTFKASVGEVAGITITTTSAQQNVKTPIKYILTDAAGIDITPNVDTKAKCIVKVEGNYSTAELGDASDAYITMTNMGDVAKVTVSYDTGAKDFTPVSATGEIKCVAAEAVKAEPVFYAAGTKDTDVNVNDKSDCAKFYLGLSDKTVSVEEDADKPQVYFCAKDANGDAVSYDSYEVEVANEDIASASVSSAADNGKFAIIQVHGNVVGTTSLNVTASKNNAKTSYVIPVTVTKKLVAVKMTVDVTRTTMSNAVDSEYTSKITPQLYDELGNKVNGNYTYEITNNGTTKQAVLTNSAGSDTEFTAGEAAAKTYTVKVTGSDNKTSTVFERNVSISVQALSEKAYTTGVPMTYAVEIDKKALDENNEKNRTSTAKLYAMCDGKFAGYVRDNTGIKIGEERTADGEYATADANTTIDGIKVAAKYGTLAFPAGTLVSGNVVSGSAIDTAFTNYTDTTSAAFTCVDTNANAGVVKYQKDDYSSLAKLGTYTVEFRLHYKAVGGKENSKNTSEDARSNKFAAVTNTFTVANTVAVPTVKVESRTVDDLTNYVEKLSTNVDMNNNTSTHESITADPSAETTNTTVTKVTVKYVIVEDERVNNGETWHFYVPINTTFTQK